MSPLSLTIVKGMPSQWDVGTVVLDGHVDGLYRVEIQLIVPPWNSSLLDLFFSHNDFTMCKVEGMLLPPYVLDTLEHVDGAYVQATQYFLNDSRSFAIPVYFR